MIHANPSVDPKAFTQALANAANSVTIVATGGPGGQAGLTVSSMCSVCAEPPVILACVSSDNEFCHAVRQNRSFSVNLLASDQQQLALIFGGMSDTPDEDRFQAGNWQTLKSGSPILQGSAISLDCSLAAQHDHGTHTIYLGRVIDLAVTDLEPLVYWQRQFVSVEH